MLDKQRLHLLLLLMSVALVAGCGFELVDPTFVVKNESEDQLEEVCIVYAVEPELVEMTHELGPLAPGAERSFSVHGSDVYWLEMSCCLKGNYSRFKMQTGTITPNEIYRVIVQSESDISVEQLLSNGEVLQWPPPVRIKSDVIPDRGLSAD